MRVIANRDMLVSGQHVSAGQAIDISPSQAIQFMALGWVKDPPPEKPPRIDPRTEARV